MGINITYMMLATKNERSILESVQVYWKYCSKYTSLLDILLVLAVFLVNLYTPSSISSKVAYFLNTSFISGCQHHTSYSNFPLSYAF